MGATSARAWALAGLLLSALATPTLAQPESGWRANGDVLVYTDTDSVQAYSPQVGAERQLDADGGTVGGRLTIDVVSAASVDVVSHATSHFRETRAQGELHVAKAFGDHVPRLSYRYSHEPDYVSHTGSLSLVSRLGTPDSTLGAGYSLAVDTISRAGSPSNAFSDRLYTHTANVGLTQVLGPRALIRAVYTFTGQWGYMEKVYRYVPLFTDQGLRAAEAEGGVTFANFDQFRSALRPPEEVPDVRLRHAFALRGMLYVPSIHSALQLDYQLYVDDWEMQAHTLEPSIRGIIRRRWELGGWVRLYRQNAAYFWRRTYLTDDTETQIPELRSADRDLSAYTAVTVGLRLGWRGEKWRIYGEASAVQTLYDDFLYRDSLTALVFQAGVEVTP